MPLFWALSRSFGRLDPMLQDPLQIDFAFRDLKNGGKEASTWRGEGPK